MAASLQLILIPISYSATIPEWLLVPGNNTTIATAQNTSLKIVLNSNRSFSWKFVPYTNHTRLLVILCPLFNTTVIRIANRDHPVSPNATLNLIYPDRQIIVQDHTSITSNINGSSKNDTTHPNPSVRVVWSSPPGIYSVLMNDMGNLVNQDDSNSILWQSYDYSTDVLLARQGITHNHTPTGRISLDDVSIGHYVLKSEPPGPVLMQPSINNWPIYPIPYTSLEFCTLLASSLW